MANCDLRDDKNTAFVISSPSLAIAGEHGKHHETRAHKQEAVSDWLNLWRPCQSLVALRI